MRPLPSRRFRHVCIQVGENQFFGWSGHGRGDTTPVFWDEEWSYGRVPASTGFVQGAVESPERCKIMMDTLVRLLRLKTVGAEWWGLQPRLEDLHQLVFIDDLLTTYRFSAAASVRLGASMNL